MNFAVLKMTNNGRNVTYYGVLHLIVPFKNLIL